MIVPSPLIVSPGQFHRAKTEAMRLECEGYSPVEISHWLLNYPLGCFGADQGYFREIKVVVDWSLTQPTQYGRFVDWGEHGPPYYMTASNNRPEA